MTKFQFQERFPTQEAAISFIIEKKYPNGEYVCPKCGCVGRKIYRQKYDSRNLYCRSCTSEFSALSGTIFANTHLDLRMWLQAINLVNISRKGISALQLQRELGMKAYSSAARMMRQIRAAMSREEMKEVFEAIVEIDETYVGGKPRKSNNRGNPTPKEQQHPRGRGTNRVAVIGVKERSTGRVHAVVANRNKDGKRLTGKQLFRVLNRCCKPNTKVMTDQFRGYDILDKPNSKSFIRLKIDHTLMYSRGNGIHTNGIESFWALLKRGIHGIYHHISTQHLQSYVNEFSFRLGNRNTEEAFEKLVGLGVR